MLMGPGVQSYSSETSCRQISPSSLPSGLHHASERISSLGRRRRTTSSSFDLYRLAMDEHERPLATATNKAPDGRRTIWKIISGCPAPPKVLVFAWRFLTNSLATWANKASQYLEVTDVCPLCGVEREDGFHALCRCPLAKELWRLMALD
ncbi:hypothetical protein D1007_47375 [Hordeum vulgare]|nr:hypothetical protein D1007_47375 [Hordeum vulgare]